ncbi:cobalamin-dependent protein [uncultured Tateyamaria sp.]|uniref:cobalamin-dependent protein n=1 Tax=uncultured Tateyamaria sp. TaxID=455651 RepID=UPI00260476FC|nr:cobalamin-dependent protein [uncultured Tateyamaria sp.]
MTHDEQYGRTRQADVASADLEPLAAQVISMLCERQTVSAAGARQVAVDYLVRACVAPAGFDPVQVLDELRGFRLTLDAVIDLYIPQAAEMLGDLWKSSDLDFAGVTVGALRLQVLLGEAAVTVERTGIAREVALQALVVVPEGEQHFLGACVLAAQLRRLGCEVAVSISETRRQITTRVICDQPDMVLISCARIAALESVSRTVKKIKSSVERVPVLALGGPLRGNADGIRDQTGVDLVTNTATDVVGFCTKRKKALSGR